jgi:HPt (histidine-containing phosphotransfer) domain-containing protein
MMERLRGEVQRGEAVIVAKTAHTLKGMTSLFAAQPLVEANRNLEIAGKEGRIADFPALLKRIESLTDLLKNELQPLIDKKNIPKKDVA